jgi:hypothetical protein
MAEIECAGVSPLARALDRGSGAIMAAHVAENVRATRSQHTENGNQVSLVENLLIFIEPRTGNSPNSRKLTGEPISVGCSDAREADREKSADMLFLVSLLPCLSSVVSRGGDSLYQAHPPRSNRSDHCTHR